MGRDNVTVSAGGVVVNGQGMVLMVNQDGKSWSLPKGHVEPAEDPLEAAVREVREEAGITELDFRQALGAYGRYKIGKNSAEDEGEWKVLIFFLFRSTQNEFILKDPRHPEARWVHPDEAENLLTHPKDKAFFKKIRSRINESP